MPNAQPGPRGAAGFVRLFPVTDELEPDVDLPETVLLPLLRGSVAEDLRLGDEPVDLPASIDIQWRDGSWDADWPSEDFDWSFPPDGYERAGGFIRTWRQTGRYHYIYYADAMRVLDGELTAEEALAALDRFECE